MSIKVKSLDFSSSIVVEIEDPHGNKSRVSFKRKLSRDQRLEIADLTKRIESLSEQEKGEAWLAYIYEQLESIEGLYQAGKEITVEMIKAGDVFQSVLALIQKCYIVAVQNDGEESEKKDTATA